MKKLILLLSILFISAVCAAYINPGMHGNIGHMQGGGCDPASNEIGDRTEYAGDSTLA